MSNLTHKILDCILITFLVFPVLARAQQRDSKPQTGGLPDLAERVEALEGIVAALQAQNAALISAVEQLQIDLANEIAARVALKDRVDAIEHWGSFFSYATIDDGSGGELATVQISGANLQVVNGTGATYSTPNGLGNIIVGYNEIRTVENGHTNPVNDRTGSHMYVGGTYNNYSSYGGIVAGYNNEVTADFSAIIGGAASLINGSNNTICGGWSHIAAGIGTVILGGQDNTTIGNRSTVSGGTENVTHGLYSSVSGGRQNIAHADSSSVSGGLSNYADGYTSSISGGWDNSTTADASQSSVSGGVGVTAAVAHSHPNTHTAP